MHPLYSLVLLRSSEKCRLAPVKWECDSWWSSLSTWFGGDHLIEILGGSTHGVNSCGDLSYQSDEEWTHREHLILMWIKLESHTCRSAPIRTSREWQLSHISEKHHRVSDPSFTLSIYFCVIRFLYLHYKNCHANLWCKIVVRSIEHNLAQRLKWAIW